MSLVQIRQVPIASAAADSQGTIGSWFSTGYYGHHRAPARVDSCHSYRRYARPHPPHKFLERQNTSVKSHEFSEHDNRFACQADPLIRATSSCFGRRRTQTPARGEFDPSFLAWPAAKIDSRISLDDGKLTTYGEAFNHDFLASTRPAEVSLSMEKSPPSKLTTYTTDYRFDQADVEQAKETRHETLHRFAANRKGLSHRQDPGLERSASVASCLYWDEKQDSVGMIDTIIPVNLQSRVPKVDRSNPYYSQSMPIFSTMQRSRPLVTIERGQRHVMPPLRATTALPRRGYTDAMDRLVSKYM